jgi:beta-galactosidase
VQYADWITLKGAQSLARYDQPHLAEFAAVTRNQFGKGIGWYVGTIVREPEFYDKLVRQLTIDAKIKPLVEPPAGVEATVRRGDNRGLLFLINHTDEEQSLPVSAGSRDLLTDKGANAILTLAPFGVAVLELPADELQPADRPAR